MLSVGTIPSNPIIDLASFKLDCSGPLSACRTRKRQRHRATGLWTGP